MPTTVTASNGDTYHLWQLGDMSAPEPEDHHSFSTLDNEMSEGFRSSQLFGLNTGVRGWTLNLPTLADTTVISTTVTDPYSASVSRQQYVRNLYKYNRTTGTPFAYRDPNNNQYYLVDMVNPDLTMAKKRNVGIYSTTIELKQRRINGVTIFDPTAILTGNNAYSVYFGDGFSTPTWTDNGAGYNMTATGDVVTAAAELNGLDVVRFNNSASTGYTYDGLTADICEVFLVMKMREATFSNNASVATANAGTPYSILTGSSGTTKFANPSLSAYNYTYRLNGTEYAQSNLQAPMNAWGVVHVRYASGYGEGDFTLGKLLPSGTAFPKMDVAECIVIGGTPLPTLMSREVVEYLSVKYDITLD